MLDMQQVQQLHRTTLLLNKVV